MTMAMTKRTASRVRSPRRDCGEEKCPAGSRNNYFLGKHLTPDSYRLEQNYAIERRRLINRAIHGWGIVYGYALATAGHGAGSALEPGEIRIGEGLGLDRLGRELIQAGAIALTLDNLLILGDDGMPVPVEGCELDERLAGLALGPEDCWLLSAHYTEQTIGPVILKDPCSCDRREWDQSCETVIYSLRRIECEQCCVPWQCELACRCPPDSPCCRQRERATEEIDQEWRALSEEYERLLEEAGQDADKVAALQADYEPRLDELAHRRHALDDRIPPRGGCACLCEHLTRLPIGADCARLSDVGDCTQADLANGLPLACLRLAQDACGDWTIGSIVDACGPRRLVKRNDLLFDLINGCDVTHIVEIGWAAWHRRELPVPFAAFQAALGGDGGSNYAEYPTRDFWVRFSRPVRADTLTPQVFAIAVMSDHIEDCWRQYFRVPIVAVDPVSGPDDPPGHAIGATIVVSGAWLRHAVDGDDSIFRRGETRVEIEVRGDLIEDCLGQSVDANPRGRSPIPSGSDGPGDSYLSAFSVAMRLPTKTVSPSPGKGRRAPTAS